MINWRALKKVVGEQLLHALGEGLGFIGIVIIIAAGMGYLVGIAFLCEWIRDYLWHDVGMEVGIAWFIAVVSYPIIAFGIPSWIGTTFKKYHEAKRKIKLVIKKRWMLEETSNWALRQIYRCALEYLAILLFHIRCSVSTVQA